MSYKKIICLANSIKIGGKCVAGKHYWTGRWIRPANTYGPLRDEQIKLDDGTAPKALDIIKIPLKERNPNKCQPENITVKNDQWIKTGTYHTDKIRSLEDKPVTLFADDPSCEPDRITENFADTNRITYSLTLISPIDPEISVEHRFGDKKVRAIFNYNSIDYDLGVTDTVYKNKYLGYDCNIYHIETGSILFCISLGGLMWNRYSKRNESFKLVAGIITF